MNGSAFQADLAGFGLAVAGGLLFLVKLVLWLAEAKPARRRGQSYPAWRPEFAAIRVRASRPR